MTFNSSKDLKNYILLKSKNAIQKSQEQIYQIINRFIKEYYAEYTPEMYERTYQLYRSLVKSDIMPINNGWEVHVYFDIDQLDYAIKKINGRDVNNNAWSEEKTLYAAAHGSHGGYIDGTAIWDEPIKLLNSETYLILKRMLIDSGIPIK